MLILAGCALAWLTVAAPAGPLGDGWKLVFNDEFDGDDAALDAKWHSQNGPSGHILCSRWRENAVLGDDLLRLLARREQRGGQDWTAASLWTRQEFCYGYFECRYRYAAATGTNNSFWIMTTGKPAQRFEIDINEGQVPNELNLNLHNHSGTHWARGGRWYYGRGPTGEAQEDAGFNFPLPQPLTTTAVRLVSDDTDAVRIMELRAFAPSAEGYPSVFPNPAEAQPPGANLALGAVATASSVLDPRYPASKANDGALGTASRWVSAVDGPHWLQLTFPQPVALGCLQLISGWQDGTAWRSIVQDFRLEYLDGTAWKPIPGASRAALQPNAPEAQPDLAHSFHNYALEWNPQELIYYFDGQEIRRTPNDICHGPAAVWLSLAIIRWAGPVTDAIDGTSMDVDYVKVWQREQP
ncbi:MAG: family 16 glycosylhydrolase [Fimbriimonadaceae bacterium]|nr:family 16 glycosylhydrolase [Fimbriimonadaceae bacterium]